MLPFATMYIYVSSSAVSSIYGQLGFKHPDMALMFASGQILIPCLETLFCKLCLLHTSCLISTQTIACVDTTLLIKTFYSPIILP